MMNGMVIKRGMIFYADLGESRNANGSEQSGKRPVIVIQNNMGNKFAPTVVVACLTSKMSKHKLPTHVFVGKNDFNGLSKDSIVLCEQIKTISKSRLAQYVGTATEITMKSVDKAIDISINYDKEKEAEKHAEELKREAENSGIVSHFVALKSMIDKWIKTTGSYIGMENEVAQCKKLEKKVKDNNLEDYVKKFENIFNNSVIA